MTTTAGTFFNTPGYGYTSLTASLTAITSAGGLASPVQIPTSGYQVTQFATSPSGTVLSGAGSSGVAGSGTKVTRLVIGTKGIIVPGMLFLYIQPAGSTGLILYRSIPVGQGFPTEIEFDDLVLAPGNVLWVGESVLNVLDLTLHYATSN